MTKESKVLAEQKPDVRRKKESYSCTRVCSMVIAGLYVIYFCLICGNLFPLGKAEHYSEDHLFTGSALMFTLHPKGYENNRVEQVLLIFLPLLTVLILTVITYGFNFIVSTIGSTIFTLSQKDKQGEQGEQCDPEAQNAEQTNYGTSDCTDDGVPEREKSKLLYYCWLFGAWWGLTLICLHSFGITHEWLSECYLINTTINGACLMIVSDDPTCISSNCKPWINIYLIFFCVVFFFRYLYFRFDCIKNYIDAKLTRSTDSEQKTMLLEESESANKTDPDDSWFLKHKLNIFMFFAFLIFFICLFVSNKQGNLSSDENPSYELEENSFKVENDLSSSDDVVISSDDFVISSDDYRNRNHQSYPAGAWAIAITLVLIFTCLQSCGSSGSSNCGGSYGYSGGSGHHVHRVHHSHHGHNKT